MTFVANRGRLVGNPVALAVYTFRQSRYMFPVLLELAIVSILPWEVTVWFQSSRSPRGQSFGNQPRESQIIRVNPEGAGRVAGR